MTPHDQERFGQLISDFVASCNFERPFHLVVIDARSTVSVAKYGISSKIEQVCSGPMHSLRLQMIPPLVVTVIASDGTGRSAKITVEQARQTVQ